MDNINTSFDSNTAVYNNITDFSKASKELLITQLQEKGIILNQDEKEKLINYYEKDKRDIKEVFNEIKNLTREDVLKKIMSTDEKKQENKISLENITEFKNDDTKKEYISIRTYYPEEELRVIENTTGQKAKELFEKFKNEDGLVTLDGFVNSMDVYKNSMEKDKNEIKMENVTELCKRGEFRKLSESQKEVVLGLVISIINELAGVSKEQKDKLKKVPVSELVKMLDKDIYLSPEENIVMVCMPNDPTKDEAMTVRKTIEGEYILTSLNNKGNKFVNDISTEEEIVEENESYEKEKQELGVSKTMKFPKNTKRPDDSKVEAA